MRSTHVSSLIPPTARGVGTTVLRSSQSTQLSGVVKCLTPVQKEWGGGRRQHLSLAVRTGPTVPLGSPSFGTQEIHGLAVRGSLLPGSGFRQKAPCLPSSSQGAAPPPAPGTPVLYFQLFSLHLRRETHPHDSPCARLWAGRVGHLGSRRDGRHGLPARPRRGASEACMRVGGTPWSWKEQPCSLTWGKCLVLSPP